MDVYDAVGGRMEDNKAFINALYDAHDKASILSVISTDPVGKTALFLLNSYRGEPAFQCLWRDYKRSSKHSWLMTLFGFPSEILNA